MAESMDLNRPQIFDVHLEPSSIDQRWTKWLKRFEIYLMAANITNDIRKKAMLLNLAGDDVLEIYENLPTPGATYEEAKTALNSHFKPKKNVLYETFKFRQAYQQESESITEFYARLRSLSSTCEFTNLDNELKTQLVVGTNSESLRKRILKHDALTLQEIIDSGRAEEVIKLQSANIATTKQDKTETVQKIYKKQTNKNNWKTKAAPKANTTNTKCRNCGESWPHEGGKAKCPAQGQTCHTCNKKNHYARVCLSSKYKTNQTRSLPVKQIDEGSGDDDEIVFAISGASMDQPPPIVAKVCNHEVKFCLDTGSSVNIIDEVTYKQLNQPPKLTQTRNKLFPYKSDKQLETLGKITTTIMCGENKIYADIYVVKGQGMALIGYKSATELGLVKLTYQIESTNYDKLREKYPKIFSGVGKLRGQQVHLHVDETVQPVAQPHRRIPFNIQSLVEKEIKRLEDADIIETVEGPTPWVSPVVVVPKPHNPEAIRLCIDMRVPNKAIKRERHITPTIDDIINKVNGAKYFSKLDLKDGYHQLELDEASRTLTTFSTHIGLRRYKRLNFGINSAAETFQNTIRQVLADIHGVLNASDDLLVFGKTQAEHDQALSATLQRLEDVGLTLNPSKCQFGVSKLRFFGYIFSAEGMKIDPHKVDAFKNLPAPTSVTEVRSILGMINYCGRFIPNLATLTLPLRKLTKQNTKWNWGNDEQQSLDKLKTELLNSKVNGFFDTKKETHLIVDAGPEGVGAILCQPTQASSGIISCASKSLTETEKRYSQIEKEMLAITWAVYHFKLYLYGANFTIHTDHKPLVSILTNTRTQTAPRLERLRLKLLGYNFKIKHTPGDTNPSDFLSRHPKMCEVSEEDETEEFINFITDHAVPTALTRETIAKYTKEDAVLQRLATAITKGSSKYWENDEVKAFSHTKEELSITHDGIIVRGRRIVVPEKLRKHVIELAHRGHQGIVRTKQLLRGKVWFPKIDQAVESKIRSCIPCLSTNPSKHRDPIQASILPKSPWEEISLDFAGPFPNGQYVMVATDLYSRFPIAEVITSTNSQTVTNKLKKWFYLFGIPRSIKTDNGPPFNGQEFKRIMESLGCKHKPVTPAWPEANGTVERFMRTLKKRIQAAVIENKNWVEEIDEFLMNYRATPHSTTERSPAEIMFRYPYQTKLPQLMNEYDEPSIVRDNDEKNKEKFKLYADRSRNTKTHDLQIDDQVLLKQQANNKYTPPFDPHPYIVTEINGTAITAERSNRKIRRNSALFKKIPAGTVASPPTPTGTDSDEDLDNQQPSVSVDPPDTQVVRAASTPGLSTRPHRAIKVPTKFKDFVLFE